MSNKEKIALAKNLDDEIDLLNKKHTSILYCNGNLEFRVERENNPIVISGSGDFKEPWYLNVDEQNALRKLMENTKLQYAVIIQDVIKRKEKELNEMFK